MQGRTAKRRWFPYLLRSKRRFHLGSNLRHSGHERIDCRRHGFRCPNDEFDLTTVDGPGLAHGNRDRLYAFGFDDETPLQLLTLLYLLHRRRVAGSGDGGRTFVRRLIGLVIRLECRIARKENYRALGATARAATPRPRRSLTA